MEKLNDEIVAFLINLDRATKRLSEMEERLSNIGIDYIRISAIDGRNYKPTEHEYNERLYKRYCGRKTSREEIGCYLSHYKAIECFIKSGKRYALILEDDAVFNSDFVKILNKLVSIDHFWDFVKFNTGRDYGFGNVAVKKLFKEYKLYASFFPKAFAAAYIINRKAAKSLYAKLLPMFVPYDHEMIKFWKYDIRQYSIFPSPVRVEYKDSFIGTYGKESLKFPFYKRISVLFYRIFTQIVRSINFYKLLKSPNKRKG